MSTPYFWVLKFTVRVASLHSLKWCRTGLPSTKLAAPACEPIRGLPKKIQIVARSKSCTVLPNITRYGSDVVTLMKDWYKLKVGLIVSKCISTVPFGMDLTHPIELKRWCAGDVKVLGEKIKLHSSTVGSQPVYWEVIQPWYLHSNYHMTYSLVSEIFVFSFKRLLCTCNMINCNAIKSLSSSSCFSWKKSY